MRVGNMSRHLQPLVQLAGRSCLGLVFLSSAAARFRYFHQHSGDWVPGEDQVSGLLLGCWISLAVAGGLAVALGWRTRWGLLMLAICTLAGQWASGQVEGAACPAGLSPSAANLGLLAAIVALIAAGPGAWSFDAGRAEPPVELGDSNVLG